MGLIFREDLYPWKTTKDFKISIALLVILKWCLPYLSPHNKIKKDSALFTFTKLKKKFNII